MYGGQGIAARHQGRTWMEQPRDRADRESGQPERRAEKGGAVADFPLGDRTGADAPVPFTQPAGGANEAEKPAPRRLTRWMRVLVPLVVLGGAAAIAAALVATRPTVERKPVPERSWTISAVPVAIADVQPDMRLLGEVVAGRSVELRPLVSGRVIEVGENYVEGGTVREGELLVAIDRFEYESDVSEREAQLLEAQARLDELSAEHKALQALLERDLEQLTLVQREVKRRADLRKRGSGSIKALDDSKMALTETQQSLITRNQNIERFAARIEQQRAVISQRQVALQRAARDLMHTRLVAPFDAFVTDRGTAVGKQVGVNDRVARLIGANWLEARFHVSDAQFARLFASGGVKNRQATVIWHTQTRDFVFKAMIERTGSEVSATSGGVDLFARIEGIDANTVLRPGVFVEVLVPDQTFEKVVRLPNAAVQGGDTVYVVKDGRLEPRAVTMVARVGNDVLVRGALQEDEQVAAATFAEIGPGVKVEIR